MIVIDGKIVTDQELVHYLFGKAKSQTLPLYRGNKNEVCATQDYQLPIWKDNVVVSTDGEKKSVTAFFSFDDEGCLTDIKMCETLDW